MSQDDTRNVTYEVASPGWQADGPEPSAEFKKSGYVAGYKPPAGFFNWFWCRVSRCIEELQQKLKGYAGANEADKTKMNAAIGQKLNTSEYTGGKMVEMLNKTSALNADTVDGKHAAAFAVSGHAHPVATTTAAGFMSASDKTNLNAKANTSWFNQTTNTANVASVWGYAGSRNYQLYKTSSLRVAYAASAGSAVDQTARNTATAALPKAGGTVSGNLTVSGNATVKKEVISDVLRSSSNTASIRFGSQCIWLRPQGPKEDITSLWMGLIGKVWSVTPGDKSGYIDLGSASYRYRYLYTTSGVQTSSDRRLKTNIHSLEDQKVETLLATLRPVSFERREDSEGKTHYGFIAQEVEAALHEAGISPDEFAGFSKSPRYTMKQAVKTEAQPMTVRDETGAQHTEMVDTEVDDSRQVPVAGEYEYTLCYEEFIPILWREMQRKTEKIQELETRLERLERGLSGGAQP